MSNVAPTDRLLMQLAHYLASARSLPRSRPAGSAHCLQRPARHPGVTFPLRNRLMGEAKHLANHPGGAADETPFDAPHAGVGMILTQMDAPEMSFKAITRSSFSAAWRRSRERTTVRWRPSWMTSRAALDLSNEARRRYVSAGSAMSESPSSNFAIWPLASEKGCLLSISSNEYSPADGKVSCRRSTEAKRCHSRHPGVQVFEASAPDPAASPRSRKPLACLVGLVLSHSGF